MTKYDSSTNTDLLGFIGCGGNQLTIGNGLNSATFSGTVTGFDFVRGGNKTVTVNVDMPATGRVHKDHLGNHYSTSEFTIVINVNGMSRSASGPLNISGDLTFSTDDASGTITKVTEGEIIVKKV
jgi:hypothetical protein